MSKKAKAADPAAPAEETPAPLPLRQRHSETLAALDAAEDGSVFAKERGQWRITYVQQGHALACGGPSIPEALDSIGAVRTHDSLGNVI